MISGPNVMRGYLERPEETARTVVDGWLHTGDRGHFRDGWFFFTGRQTDLIKTKGANVAPAEVEKAIMAHPGVALAFVFGVDHADRGQDVVALVAVPGGDVQATLDDLSTTLRDQLSSYKLPRHLFPIAPEDVPYLTSQKPDRLRLAELASRLTADAERS